MSRSSVGALFIATATGILASTAFAEASVEPRFDAFRTVCVPDRQDYDALKRRALVEGWVPAKAGLNAELDSLMEVSRDVEFDPDVSASLASYAKAIAGGEAFLVLTYYASEQVDLVGCYLYDFAADEPMGPDEISDWLGQPPSEVVDQPSVIIGQTWGAPERLPGTWDVYLAFLPEGSAASAMTGFSGVVLKISSVHPKEM